MTRAHHWIKMMGFWISTGIEFDKLKFSDLDWMFR